MTRTSEAACVLALWNGVDPAWQAAYEAWHAQEHVPERLTPPGLREAWRYGAVDGGPSYFTLYFLDSFDALRTAAYRELVEHPTPWSRAMRPRLTGFVRQPGWWAWDGAPSLRPPEVLWMARGESAPRPHRMARLRGVAWASDHPLATGAGQEGACWDIVGDTSVGADGDRWRLLGAHRRAGEVVARPSPRDDLFRRHEGHVA